MKKRIIALLLVLLLATIAANALAAGYDDARNSVVRIYANASFRVYDKDGNRVLDDAGDPVPNVTLSWLGSGFAIGMEGEPVQYIVTNRHVVLASQTSNDKYIYDPVSEYGNMYVITDDKSTQRPATIACVSDRTDLAVLRLNSPITDRVPCVLRSFKSLSSENVYTLGFPGDADMYISDGSSVNYPSTPDHVTLRSGIVSRVLDHAETQDGQQIQHDAAINGGNSGGPLVDVNGYVLGVNTYSINGAEGLTSSISSNEVIRLLEDERIEFMTTEDLESPEAGTTVLAPVVTESPIASPDPTPELTPEPTPEPGPVQKLTDFVKAHPAPVIVAVAAVISVALIVCQMLRNRSAESKPNAPKDPFGVNSNNGQKINYTVVFETGALAGKPPRQLTSSLTIGRAKSCTIVFPEDTPMVSHLHCTLRITSEGVMITDHSSTGTFINGEQIPPKKPVRLHRNQRVSLGSNKQSFTLRG